MRKFQNVSRYRQSKLEAQFPDILKLVQVEPSVNYTYVAVSIFDHWLSREESMEYLSNLSHEEIERRGQVFDCFNQLLINNTEILTFRFKGISKSRPQFKNFSSQKVLSDYLRQTDIWMYETVLPELTAVYFEGYDDTNILYLRDLAHKPTIEKWAKEVGLHCLEQW